jgi:hypothetical protein
MTGYSIFGGGSSMKYTNTILTGICVIALSLAFAAPVLATDTVKAEDSD